MPALAPPLQSPDGLLDQDSLSRDFEICVEETCFAWVRWHIFAVELFDFTTSLAARQVAQCMIHGMCLRARTPLSEAVDRVTLRH